jgi:hypothetical protein
MTVRAFMLMLIAGGSIVAGFASNANARDPWRDLERVVRPIPVPLPVPPLPVPVPVLTPQTGGTVQSPPPPPVQGPMPPVVYGNFCATSAGVFGPGPSNPVGASCVANTPWGQVFGRVVM